MPARATAAAAALLAVVPWAFAAAGAAKPPPHHGPQGSMVQAIHARLKALQEECEKNAKAWEPRAQVGEMCLRFGLPDIAARRLEEAIALRPERAQLYHLAGQAHFQLKHYERAIALWKKALELLPADTRPHSWIRQAQAARDDESQLAAAEEKLAENPSDPDALLARARILARRGKWKEAHADLAAVLKAAPDSRDALPLAAMANYRLGHLDQAIELWQRAVAANPQDEVSRVWLGRATELERIHDRLGVLEADIHKNPKSAEAWREAGQLYARLGKWQRAAVYLGEAVGLAPKDAAARKSYGLVLFRMGKMDEAVAQLEECVELEPENPTYSRSLENLKRMREVHKAMRKRGGWVPGSGMKGGGDSRR